jgi:hypothetical protein
MNTSLFDTHCTENNHPDSTLTLFNTVAIEYLMNSATFSKDLLAMLQKSAVQKHFLGLIDTK